MTDPALKRQAELTNRQISTGSALVGVMQNMDTAVQNVADKFKDLATGPLAAFSKAVMDLTGMMNPSAAASMPVDETVAATGGAP